MEIVIITLCIAILSTAYAIKTKIEATRSIDSVNRVLQSILNRNISNELSGIEETKESKIVHQAHKVLAMYENEVLRSINEKDSIKELIGDISHQVRTPVANIHMFIELLEDDSLSIEEKHEFLSRTKEQAQKLEWLMEALMKMSRLESGVMNFETKPQGIKTTVAKAVGTMYGKAQHKNIEIRIDEFEDCILNHNVKWTVEALCNVLENAIKYSRENKKIIIAIEPLEIYTKIKVIDEGKGIDKEDFNNIFKRFYRCKDVQEIEGMGIGLYLTQQILMKQGGYMTVSSSKNNGSVFSMFLQNC